MIGRVEVFFRRMRRWVSRSEWMVRLYRLPKSRRTATEPGLVLIQIDGLAKQQFERALARGRMPFLRRLIQKHHYSLHTHYSGLPSNTPGVQGELFYGVRSAVPAFSFYDRAAKRTRRMFETEDAREIEERLRSQGNPLLTGGAAYSDVYTGGASESHFCMSGMDLSGVFRKVTPLTLPLTLLLNLPSFLRVAGLMAVEFTLALVDSLRGLVSGHDLWKELKFVPTRVGICILLRELVSIGVQVDVARGVPIVHLNFLGYDEQAHRRGPSSEFAHWTLHGIDRAIRRIWWAAHRSTCRDYDVWIFSDHGQEETVPYSKVHKVTLDEKLASIFDQTAVPDALTEPDRGVQLTRIHHLGWKRFLKYMTRWGAIPKHEGLASPLVAGMGPLSHVYWPRPLTTEEQDQLAHTIVSEAHIPLVLAKSSDRQARAWTAHGVYTLPEQADIVFGKDHPFLEEVGRDLAALCHHPNAGDWVISGWRRDGPYLTFPIENGSHAGPGPQETQGFLLMPEDAPLPRSRVRYVRPSDLRKAVLAHMAKHQSPEAPYILNRSTPPDTLRVMTYNVHGCVGMDGKHSPHRIARLIAQFNPDVVALQELDMGRLRSHGHDQAKIIARYLRMDHHFHPAWKLEEEQYGDAILSRLPMRLVRAAGLPSPPGQPGSEPRGALWVSVDVDGAAVQIINTHLGLGRLERQTQSRALLDREWMLHPDFNGACVLCGDFNTLPGTGVYRRFRRRMHDAQKSIEGHRPKKTWFGRYPLGRIDHVFVSSPVQVIKVEVPKTGLSRVASDHLPLIVDLKIKKRIG